MSLTFNQTDNSYCNNNALREQSESNTAYTNSYNLHESYVSNVKQHTFSRSECAFRKGKWTVSTIHLHHRIVLNSNIRLKKRNTPTRSSNVLKLEVFNSQDQISIKLYGLIWLKS